MAYSPSDAENMDILFIVQRKLNRLKAFTESKLGAYIGLEQDSEQAPMLPQHVHSHAVKMEKESMRGHYLLLTRVLEALSLIALIHDHGLANMLTLYA